MWADDDLLFDRMLSNYENIVTKPAIDYWLHTCWIPTISLQTPILNVAQNTKYNILYPPIEVRIQLNERNVAIGFKPSNYNGAFSIQYNKTHSVQTQSIMDG